jgi:hypothetical protein
MKTRNKEKANFGTELLLNCFVFTAFTTQEFDWLLSFLVPGSVYLGLSALVPILTEALTLSITDVPGILAKISTILTTLFYTIVAVFIFGISIVSIAHNIFETACNLY